LAKPKSLRVLIADLNGIPRGKRLPISYLKKILSSSSRMPLSVLNLDILGNDIEDSPLVFESGDADGTLFPTDRGPVSINWLKEPTVYIQHQSFNEDNSPFSGDPRQALISIMDRYKKKKLSPIVSTELEFCLTNASGLPTPANSPATGKPMVGQEILSLQELDGLDGFFNDLYDACDLMNISAQAAITESGLGQFEINLNHGNAIKIADDTWLFRQATRGVALKHGMRATFMAKPYAQEAGNGLHVHFSILDNNRKNIFDNASEKGSKYLLSAISGCLDFMQDSTLIFAPNHNSYDRFIAGAHAPTIINWGYENRTTAIRIPGGPNNAKRIEHRVAGGDANPYLVLAAILGAALNGMENKINLPKPISGNGYNSSGDSIIKDWKKSIERFSSSQKIKEIFDPLLIRSLVDCKKQELNYFKDKSHNEIIQTTINVI
jgi:glutamine synthetase